MLGTIKSYCPSKNFSEGAIAPSRPLAGSLMNPHTHFKEIINVFDTYNRLLKSKSWAQQIGLVFSSEDRTICFRLILCEFFE
jgi:hypothetical protein